MLQRVLLSAVAGAGLVVMAVAYGEHLRHPTVESSQDQTCVNAWNGYRSCVPGPWWRTNKQ